MSTNPIPHDSVGTAGHEPIKQALRVLIGALGAEDRQPVTPELLEGVHPVFLLAEHVRSHDDGNGMTPHRGDALSVPAFSEHTGGVLLLQTSFHKGNAHVEVVTFPDADPVHEHAVHVLLEQAETR